jgi:hypothetical protein
MVIHPCVRGHFVDMLVVIVAFSLLLLAGLAPELFLPGEAEPGDERSNVERRSRR